LRVLSDHATVTGEDLDNFFLAGSFGNAGDEDGTVLFRLVGGSLLWLKVKLNMIMEPVR
jgi:hypothetical protein